MVFCCVVSRTTRRRGWFVVKEKLCLSFATLRREVRGGKNFESLHVRRSVTQVTTEMHNVFSRWEASTESRDIVGSLWTCPTYIDICAVGWLQCRLCFYHESGAGNMERIHFTSTHFATEAVTRLYSPTTFTDRIFRFFHYKNIFRSFSLFPTYIPLQEKNYSRQGFFFQHVFQSLDPNLVLWKVRVSHQLQNFRQG
jgi:hypothetical protein